MFFKITKRKILFSVGSLLPIHFALQSFTPIYNYLPFVTADCASGNSPNQALGCVIVRTIEWNYLLAYVVILLVLTYLSVSLLDKFLTRIKTKR